MPASSGPSSTATSTTVNAVSANSDADSDVLPLAAPIHHERFYLPDDGMAIFDVQGRLYKVHRYIFIRESDVFKAMFDHPPGPGSQVGSSDENAIHLPQVTAAQFEALLEFFYDGMFNSNKLKTKEVSKTREFGGFGISQLPSSPEVRAQQLEDEKSRKKLHDLLSISLLYSFNRLTDEIVSAIDSRGENMDPVLKLSMALKHNVLRHWVQPVFIELVDRPAPLTWEEISTLGPKKTAVICKWREEHTLTRSDSFHGGSIFNDPIVLPPEFYSDD
ncbi:hypothetical protein BDZ97DRAFT_1177626 [Flammula alnicola]|nr:hypothetical protein BDZ97DRAFT_1177626 [Flammula alnicola]